MKHHIVTLGVLLGLVSAGCDTVNRTQYQVSGPASIEGVRASVSAADRAEVKEVLSAVATRLHFEDRTQVSLVPNTIVLFAQTERRDPVRILAWEKQGSIIIDITHTPTTPGETAFYRRVQSTVFTELQNRFGPRATIPARKSLATGVPASTP